MGYTFIFLSDCTCVCVCVWQRKQEYKRAYSKYLLSLPDDVRQRLQKEDVDKPATKKKSPSLASLPTQSPVMAMHSVSHDAVTSELFISPPTGERRIVMSLSVCLSCLWVCLCVCLSAITSLEIHVRSSPNYLYTLPVAIGPSLAA